MILHLIDSAGLYGAEKMVLALAAEQLRRGLEVQIGSITPPERSNAVESAAVALGVEVARIEMPAGVRLGGARRLAGYLAANRCELVHTHGYKANVLMELQSHRRKRPCHVVTLHGWTSYGQLSRNGIYEALDRWMLRFADAAVIVSERMRCTLRASGETPVLHIPNGIPSSPDHSPPLDPEIVSFCRRGRTMVCIGRLVPGKGHATVLQALRLLNDRSGANPIQLLLLGDGPLRSMLAAEIERLSLQDYVHVAGYVDDAWRALNLCDVLVISSLTEGLPVVLLEAMRAGVPIVTTPVGDIPQATRGSEGAWYFPPGDAEALVEQIQQVYGKPDDRARRVALSVNRCRDHYSLERVADQYSRVYEIANERRAARQV